MKLLLDHTQLESKVQQIADIYNDSFYPQPDVVLGTLVGATFFFCDLVRKFKFDFEVDFIKPHSHDIIGPIGNTSLDGKNVLVVEDIIDTGATSQRIVDYLDTKNVNRIDFCSLLMRKGFEMSERLKKRSVSIGYCLEIEKGWAIGYGMDDFKGKKRNLPNIYLINE